MGTHHLRLALLPLVVTGASVATGGVGTSSGRIVTIDRGAYNASVSPDGSTIAFGALGRIWLLPIAGGDATPLTDGTGWDHHPAWSADGGQLAYVHDTPVAAELTVHSFTTGTTRTVHGRPQVEPVGATRWGGVYSFGGIAFHPTNGRLHYIDFRSGIWSVSVTSRTSPVQLVAGSERIGRPGINEASSFAFSPDGQSLVVEQDVARQWSHIYLSPVDAPQLTQMTVADTVKRSAAGWSRDGTSVVYIERIGGRESLVVHPVDGDTSPHRVELGSFNGRELALHPDGAHAVIESGRRLFMMNLVTGAQRAIPFRASLSLPARTNADLIIANARLFDATGGPVIENATVEIRDGMVHSITKGQVPHRAGVRVVDASGRFLMPGLADAHSHVTPNTALVMGNPLLRGITTLFDPGSPVTETLNVRDAIDLGIVEGPRVFTAGPTIDGREGRSRYLTIANVTAADDARALVRELAAMGVDAIKLYAFASPAVVAAVIAEGHAHRLPVIGDFVATPWSAALDAGVDGFVHLMDHKWRFLAKEPPPESAGPWAVVDPDDALMNDFFAKVAAQGGMFDPTMMASSEYFQADDFIAALTQEKGDARLVHKARILAHMLRTMHRHGVRWVAGTDASPGSLLQELRIYEAIGIPHATVLQTTTANVARWIKRTDFGTVEPGKRADLILVDGDPLRRIRDLENVVVVVQNGRIVVER